MAASVSAVRPSAYTNGTTTPSPAEDVELTTQLLKLQDVVLAGEHPQFKLPRTAIEQLKAASIVPEVAANHSAYATNNASTSVTQPNGLPGLHTPVPTSPGLDPIFLQKSPSLVRAERALKRKRIEDDLQLQCEQRKQARGGHDAPEGSHINLDQVLKEALDRVKPVSGLKPEKAASVSSFDENDYYSSRAPSPWSSNASSSKGSDKGAGAFTADFERLDPRVPHTALAESSRSAQKRAVPSTTLHAAKRSRHAAYDAMNDDDYEPEDAEDEDDEYIPPDASAFDSARPDIAGARTTAHVTPPEDDNSDYEPGEITQESAVPTPYQHLSHAAQPPAQVPVFRNHLSHIAAPQPSRVSPLTTTKSSNIELELVNGKPEVVRPKPQHRTSIRERVSSASPSAAGPGGKRNKQRNKKRKRDVNLHEPSKKQKRRPERFERERDRRDQNGGRSPMALAEPEPYIKDEPVSPPPFAPDVPEVPHYQPQYRPAPLPAGTMPPRQAPAAQYTTAEPTTPGMRYRHNGVPPLPHDARVASPGAHRPIQRDTQDLRRVASLHYAHRPASPPQPTYSPVAPYRSASMAYSARPPTHGNEAQPSVQYVRDVPSPALVQYSNLQSQPAAAPPPKKRIIYVDQYGNRYEPVEPATAPVSARASVGPVERRPVPPSEYERAPSRMSNAGDAYQASRFRLVDRAGMPPPPPPPLSRRAEQPVEYVDQYGRPVPAYSTRPAEPVNYAPAPTSPVYEVPRYGTMPPPAPYERTSPVYHAYPQYQPAPPAAEPLTAPTSSTILHSRPRHEAMPPPPAPMVAPRLQESSPVYQAPPRGYSAHPEALPQVASNYVRQGSMAPVQYLPRDMAPPPQPASVRAMSVAPSTEYGGPLQQPAYAYPTQQSVRYVDQYGRELQPAPEYTRQGTVARY
ncbi:hypothetical protein BAUCODRAFT_34041 [Baudoinia panamericana UAMH 10762]|uniref:Uncharacterized protein n=1 Tax=Baudoinia panamericana (strain UAMH 10762) TaxID=717646 RepID=M2NBX5_BAUPA|nr:uncharacterized protein BAUCODRAFT_34041 [Baudoinia panamericana UAMH 10762]EMC96664.1 hypothetical protein BAUCODRAFT_34041 [Baudoinia panamericana UAMH 10762]